MSGGDFIELVIVFVIGALFGYERGLRKCVKELTAIVEDLKKWRAEAIAQYRIVSNRGESNGSDL